MFSSTQLNTKNGTHFYSIKTYLMIPKDSKIKTALQARTLKQNAYFANMKISHYKDTDHI